MLGMTSPETTAFPKVGVDEVRHRASRMKFGQAVLTMITAVFWAVGWVVAKFFAVIWGISTWAAAAMQLGWREARGTRRRPTRGDLETQNAALRRELERIQ